jgi:cytoskeletal protein RodZ
MRTRNHARPAGAEQDREPIVDWHPGAGTDPLGERLVAAREAKGIDLLRAERETKIRRAYLAALERGDYASLPGGVYVRGFLRNYAQYLGLDSDEAVAQWHREAPADAPEPVIVVPRPLVAARKGLVLSSGVVVAAVVTVVVLAILAYIGFQLVRFSEPPPLSVVRTRSAGRPSPVASSPSRRRAATRSTSPRRATGRGWPRLSSGAARISSTSARSTRRLASPPSIRFDS